MMIPRGKYIEAKQVELLISEYMDGRTFAALCDNLIWASAGFGPSSIPSFTGRVNVKDQGRDGSWEIHIQAESGVKFEYLRDGFNVYQYKMRDVTARDRSALFNAIKADVRNGAPPPEDGKKPLGRPKKKIETQPGENPPIQEEPKGALRLYFDEAGRRPQSYIFFTNLDLTPDQKDDLRKTIILGYDDPALTPVTIVSAAEIATIVNDHPHLRLAFFASGPFITWERGEQHHINSRNFGKAVPFVGRDSELADLKLALENPEIRALIVSGPSEVGKDRLVLEATRDRSHEAVFCDSSELQPSDIDLLENSKSKTLIVVPDADTKLVAALVQKALSTSGIQVIITVTNENPNARFKFDPRIAHFSLRPFTQAHESTALLYAANAPFDLNTEAWAIEGAGGLPGLLLQAINAQIQERPRVASFLETIGESLQDQVQQRFGDKAVEVLGFLSLLNYVKQQDKDRPDLPILLKHFGDGTTVRATLNEVDRLKSAQLVEAIGHYWRVQPPILARHLAQKALRGRLKKLMLLFSDLSAGGRLRLVQVIRSLHSPEATEFLTSVVGPEGLLSDWDVALNHLTLVHAVAASLPDKAAPYLEQKLKVLTLDERKAIHHVKRYELTTAIEEFLYRESSCAAGLRCLCLLAESNKDHHGLDRTTFAECFNPSHRQMPMSLVNRLAFLNEMIGSDQQAPRRLLAIDCIARSFGSGSSFSVRPAAGPQPYDKPAIATYGDIERYLLQEVDLLIKTAMDSSNGEVVREASTALVSVLRRIVVLWSPDRMKDLLNLLVSGVTSNQIEIDISSLSEALLVVAGRHDTIATREATKEEHPEVFVSLKAVAQTARELVEQMEKSNFDVRLKRWAGQASVRDLQSSMKATSHLTTLAQEAYANPEVLDRDLFSWLASPSSAFGYIFARELGTLDQSHTQVDSFAAVIEEATGTALLASYLHGLRTGDPEFVIKFLDQAVQEKRWNDDLLVALLLLLLEVPRSIERIEAILTRNQEKDRIMTTVGGSLQFTSWAMTHQPEVRIRWLRLLAGPGHSRSRVVVCVLSNFLDTKTELSEEEIALAWECLESPTGIDIAEDYAWDHVARYVSEQDNERGFALLQLLLERQNDSYIWNPIDRTGNHRFWNYLASNDRKRAVGIALDQSLIANTSGSWNHWDMRSIIDLTDDSDQLIAFLKEGKEHGYVVGRSIQISKRSFYEDGDEVATDQVTPFWQASRVSSDENEANEVAEEVADPIDPFWKVACAILEKYPEDNTLKLLLLDGITGRHPLEITRGPDSERLARAIRRLKLALPRLSCSFEARAWLEQLAQDLTTQADHARQEELDEDINRLKGLDRNSHSPEMIWVIENLLQKGALEEVLEVISRDELVELLASMSLPEPVRARVQARIGAPT